MIAEALTRPVGFVLGGGGSLGASQVGMLQALAEHHIVADVVVGSSVGSLNGAIVAIDPAGAASRLSHAWAGMTREVVFPGGLLAQARTLQRTRTHLFPSSGLAAVITGFLGAATSFAELAVPFGAVTTNIATAQPYMITSGLLLPALLASAAIPAIYPPVDHDGRQLYDGGVVANVPMRQALAMGARSLVVLDCTFPGHLPPVPETAADAVFYTVFVTMRAQAVLEAPIAAAEVPVVYLPSPSLRRISPLDFTYTGALIDEAHSAARMFLENVRIDGPGCTGLRPADTGSWCEAAGIKHVTVFLCSTENLLHRDDAEVAFLMQVIEQVVVGKLARAKPAWQVHIAGLLDVIPDSTARALKDAVVATSSCSTGAHVTLAIGYGGRQELLDAIVSLLCEQAEARGTLTGLAETLTTEDIARHLYTAGQPDPDLVIRTSGEQRLSNFLLWQSAYSELYFCDSYWPGFREIDFLRVLRSYAARRRRHGA